ncbi:MAG TPA: DUF3891 family protein [Terriglobales bacterium]|nr:DUF3891 family protein [Terriglobales bacterium]
MILRPAHVEAPQPAASAIPAWNAILRSQQQPGEDCWLITQPDHAALAGDVAANLALPEVTAEVVRAIALHDEGWAACDQRALDATGPPGASLPRSFVAMPVAEFVAAWSASIDRAESVAPIGGLIVSEHFCWLADEHLSAGGDAPEDAARLRAFLENEHKRRIRLRERERRPPAEVEKLLQALQFCDLVSLYLCCGAATNVEFPQRLAGPRPIRLRREREACLFEPTPFRSSFDLAIAARRGGAAEPHSTTFPFFLW